MQIATLGINHKCADVSLREQIAKCLTKVHDFSHVLLATCNRFEIYFSTEDLAETHSYLLGLLKESIEGEFEHKLYAYFSTDCFVHLAKVTAGLDSAILGETEIQGQVKTAYEKALLAKTASLELHFLFQKALHLAKHVRTTMPHSGDLLAEVVGELCHPFTGKNVLFVGLSEINRPLIKYLQKKMQVFLMNRSHEKAAVFAQERGIKQVDWGDFAGYDVLVFGTSAGKWLYKVSDLGEEKPSLILDLSVPRNVDPLLSQYVSLINIDQINVLVAAKRLKLPQSEELVMALSLSSIESFRRRRAAKLVLIDEVMTG